MKTSFSGGSGSDNWDIKNIELDAVVSHLGAASPHPILPTSVAASAPRSARTATATQTSAAAVAPMIVGPSPWQVVPTTNTGIGENVLNGVTCADPTDCFAVGFSSDVGNTPRALIERSNGGSSPFNMVSTPDTGESYSELDSVSCLSATNCVAVGFDGSGSPEGDSNAGTKQLLIESWNGTNWTVTESGNPGGDVSSELTGVSCVPSGQQPFCAAVGYETSTGVARTLTMISSPASGWIVVPSPNADNGDNLLYGVSCSSSSQCDAVGYSDGTGFAQTLTLGWGGSSWTVLPSGNAGVQGNVFDGMGDNVLYSVSCPDAAHCVSVGVSINENRIAQTLVETQQPSGPTGQEGFEPAPAPNPGQSGNLLLGVSCTTPIDCKAVGVQFDGNIDATLNENYDGTNWFATPTPSPGPDRNFLLGDACLSPTSCVAVGDLIDPAGVKQTLALNLVPTSPNAPTNPVAVSGDEQAEISFTPPTDNGGFNITNYTVTAKDVTHASNGGQTASASASPVTLLGLTNGDEYRFKVTATNLLGTGPPSKLSKAIVIAPSGVTNFKPMTLQHGWATPAGAAPVAAAVKSSIVYFKGQMRTAGANPVAFTLPATMRPVTTVFVPVDLCGVNNGDLSIAPSGAVTVEAEGGAFANAQCGTSLDGVSFALLAATPLVLQNGWTNSPFGTSVVSATSKSGEVYLKGAIAGGTSPIAFKLPANLRPPTPVYVPVDLCGANNGDLFIQTTGIVTIRAGAFANAQCMTSLDGVRFSLTASTPLPLLNGWTNSPLGTSAAAATTGSGLVFLRGAISTGATNPVAFKLPVQMRPAADVFVPVDLCNGSNGDLVVQPSGIVTVEAEGGVFADAQCMTSLDGVFYDS